MKSSEIRALTGLAAVFGLLLAPVSDSANSELMHAIQDALHGPLFALVAIGALRYLQDRQPAGVPARHYGLAFLMAITLGGLAEIAQWALTSSRHAEWKDVRIDAFGALLGLCLYAWFDAVHRPRRKHLLLAAAVIVSFLIAAPVMWSSYFYLKRRAQLPELITWGGPTGYHFVTANSAALSIESCLRKNGATGTSPALYIKPEATGPWPGVSIDEPWPDWRDYSRLAIEVINPGAQALELILRIDDRRHNNQYDDRFNHTLTIAAGSHETLLIPLTDVQHAPATRQLDMSHIGKLILFQNAAQATHAYYLCSMRLLK